MGRLPGARGLPGSGWAPPVGHLPRHAPPSGTAVLAPGATVGTTPRGASPAEVAVDPYYGQRANAFVNPFPAWQPDVIDVVRVGSQTLAANTLNTTLITYTPSNRAVFYITGFGQDAPTAGFQEVTWYLLVGGQIVLTIPAVAQVASFIQRLPLHIPVKGGTEVRIVVDMGANQRLVGAILTGIEKGVDFLAPEQT